MQQILFISSKCNLSYNIGRSNQIGYKNEKSKKHIVLLLPEAGDQSSQVCDNKELAQDMDSAFEPAGALEVKKHVLGSK